MRLGSPAHESQELVEHGLALLRLGARRPGNLGSRWRALGKGIDFQKALEPVVGLPRYRLSTWETIAVAITAATAPSAPPTIAVAPAAPTATPTPVAIATIASVEAALTALTRLAGICSH